MSDETSPWWMTLASKLAAIDPAFAGEIDRLAEEQVDLMERALRLQAGDRILDLGCGAGRHSCLLQERGYALTGLDLAPAVLDMGRDAWARRHPAQDGPRWILGDMRNPPLAGPFDVIISMDAAFGVFDDEADHLSVLVAAAERLVRGGRLLLEIPNAYYWANNQTTRHFPPGTLAADAHIVRSYRFDPLTGRLKDQILVFRRGPEPEALPVQSLRAWAPTEISSLVQAAGFQDVRIFGMDGWRVPAQPLPLDAARSAFTWVTARLP